MPLPRLRDHRNKLTSGTILGVVNVIYAVGYNMDRSVAIQKLTVDYVLDDTVVFRKVGGHEMCLPLHQCSPTYYSPVHYLPQHSTLMSFSA